MSVISVTPSSMYGSIWSASRKYAIGATVLDRGGLWLCVATNTNSRPLSGNANWTLVGGTPYVDVILDPVALTTAPFYDPTQTGPGVVLLPAPGANLLLLALASESVVGAGDPWGLDHDTSLTYTNTAGLTVPLNVVDNLAQSPLTQPFSRRTVATDAYSDLFGLLTAIDSPVVIYTSDDLTNGGANVGTRSVRYRVFYSIAPTTATMSTFFHITAVNQGTKTFTVSPDPTGVTGAITIVGSTGNNGAYTVAATTATTITVNEAIPSAVADGWLKK